MSGKTAGGDNIFSVERIRELVELMEQHELSEIDLQHDKQKIRLARGGGMVAMPNYMPQMAAPPAPAAAPAAAAVAVDSAPAASASIVTIDSPMVGTFYSKPNPESGDFVSVGSKVTAETVICIIEAMKVFNEINAEISGTIVEVLVANGEPVDFGKPLFKVDTKG